MYHVIPRLAALALVAASSTGCVMHARSLERTRLDIEKQLPGARFDSQMKLTLGRMSLGLAKKIVRWANADEPELAVLRDIHRVELAIYRTERLPPVRDGGFSIPRAARLSERGWETVVESIHDDGAVWVMARGENKPVEEILVGALDDDELVLVKVRGDVERMLQRLHDEGELDLPGVVHADLEPEPGDPIAVVDGDLEGK